MQMLNDPKLLSAARKALRLLKPIAAADTHFRLVKEKDLRPTASATDGAFIECGELLLNRRHHSLLLATERYADRHRHYWFGVEATTAAVMDLEDIYRAGGQTLGPLLTEHHEREIKPGLFQLTASLHGTLWGKTIPERYGSYESFFGKYLKASGMIGDKLARLAVGFWNDLSRLATLEAAVLEGEPALHKRRARSRSEALRREAVKRHSKGTGRLKCEACPYSAPANDPRLCVIEFHHVDPVSNYGAKGKKLSVANVVDLLKPLCPTCHRIAHRGETRSAPLPIEEVAKLRRKLPG
jgi:hypothetical protein